MKKLHKYILGIILLFSIGTNIALLTNQPNTDIVILDIAQNSYFVGCVNISLDFVSCRQMSKQYRKEFRDNTGLEDRAERY